MKETKTFKLTQAQQQVVDKKVKDLNDFLATADLSILYGKDSKAKKPSKS